MMEVFPAAERGRTTADGWLDSRHSFSCGDYYNPARLGYRSLRVLNEDRVGPGSGSPRQGHQDLEILCYVLEGALEHEDSAGGHFVIRPGAIQLTCAGTGVVHSDINASRVERVHFLQIWIVPGIQGLPPSYGHVAIDREEAKRAPVRLASRIAQSNVLQLHQDVELFTSQAPGGTAHMLPLDHERHAYVHVAVGRMRVNGELVEGGDAVALTHEPEILIEALDETNDALIFDLA
jgi:redox-sensitive bicupin YhaK (pirin superfamily)